MRLALRVGRLDHQHQPIYRHAQRRPSSPEHTDNLELLLPPRAHLPRQRDRHDEDHKVRRDGDAEVREEDLALVEAPAVDGRVPVRLDRVADVDLGDLDGDVGEGEDEDEGVDGVCDPRPDGEDAGDEQEEGDFGEEGGWAVDEGAYVQPLGGLSVMGEDKGGDQGQDLEHLGVVRAGDGAASVADVVGDH